MINLKKSSKLGIPPAFSERCAIRCTDHKVAPNKSGNPMITANWELIGFFNDKNNGALETEISRGGQLYKLAGMRVPTQRWTLTEKAISFYQTVWEAAHPGEEMPTEFDEENPDTDWLKDCVLQVLISGGNKVSRKQLTEEEREEGKTEGDPILDDEGNQMEDTVIYINKWLKPYGGDIPPF